MLFSIEDLLGVLHIHRFIQLFFFNHTMWHIATDATCHHIKIHMWFLLRRGGNKESRILCSLHLAWKIAHHYASKWQTTLYVTAERKQVRVSTVNVEQHACLSVCARACPSCLALLELNTQILSRPSYFQQYQRRFSASGAILELLSSAWLKYMHNSCLSVAHTSGGNHKSTVWG